MDGKRDELEQQIEETQELLDMVQYPISRLEKDQRRYRHRLGDLRTEFMELTGEPYPDRQFNQQGPPRSR